MDLSIIIVSWNVREKLRENLKALFALTPSPSPTPGVVAGEGGLSTEVFVVDNNSSDGSAEMVKNEFPQINLIANQENLGFAKANNQAIKKSLQLNSGQAQGDFILLLNPDMKVFPDTLANMVKWMRENKQASVAGCHLVDEAGNTIKHVRRFPRFSDQLAIALKIPHLFSAILNNYLRVDFDYKKSAKVDSVRGGFFMIRKEVLEKIGLLDERFFLWFEEVDYCLRVKKSGGEVWFTPDAKCVDYVGQSFLQVKRGVTQKYFRDSMLKYFKKWHPCWQYHILKTAWPLGMLIAKIGETLKFRSKVKT
jgi:GT2 family glycosyltransferase